MPRIREHARKRLIMRCAVTRTYFITNESFCEVPFDKKPKILIPLSMTTKNDCDKDLKYIDFFQNKRRHYDCFLQPRHRKEIIKDSGGAAEGIFFFKILRKAARQIAPYAAPGMFYQKIAQETTGGRSVTPLFMFLSIM